MIIYKYEILQELINMYIFKIPSVTFTTGKQTKTEDVRGAVRCWHGTAVPRRNTQQLCLLHKIETRASVPSDGTNSIPQAKKYKNEGERGMWGVGEVGIGFNQRINKTYWKIKIKKDFKAGKRPSSTARKITSSFVSSRNPFAIPRETWVLIPESFSSLFPTRLVN